MAGVLNLSLVRNPVAGDSITVVAKYLNTQNEYSFVNLRIKFVEFRSRNGEASISSGPEGPIIIASTGINFANAFNIDYGNTGGQGNLFATGGANPTITLKNEFWLFENVIVGSDLATFTINNEEIETPKSFTFEGFDVEASDCDNLVANFRITGGEQPYTLYKEVTNGPDELLGSNLSNDVSVSVGGRGEIMKLIARQPVGFIVASLTLRTPRKLISSDIDVRIDYTDVGAAINLTVDFISEFLLPLEFSLDGTNYQPENVFTGQANGDYTVYVKDAFGCVTSKDIAVDGSSEIADLVFENISIMNPIRYAEVQLGAKKNRYNTLSHEQEKSRAYDFNHIYTLSDNPVTQIKTNAAYLNIFALSCDGEVTGLSPIKRSNHIGQVQKTTATKFARADGNTGVYFGAVDILDPLTDEVLSDQDFGYQVPLAFDKEGRYVNVEGLGVLPINRISYDEDYEAFILEFDVAYSGEPEAVTIKATYNIQNYEVYEFITPMASLPEDFNVVIEAGLSESDIRRTFISEKITRVEDSNDIVELIYWNSESFGSMNYNTGVVHTLRLHTVLSRLNSPQTVDGYDGDTQRFNTKHELFDGEEYIFGYLSEAMALKVQAILAHDRLTINGVPFKLGDVPEIAPSYTTNLCNVTAPLRTGGDVTESFESEIVTRYTGEGVDPQTYELENAIATAKGKALMLWKS